MSDDSARLTEVTAVAIAAAVTSVDGVCGLSAGPHGQFRGYLDAGRSVPGVRLDDDALALNAVVRWGRPLPELAGDVAAAVAPWTGGRTVSLTIEDIVLPGETGPDRADSFIEQPPAGVAVPGRPRPGPGR